MSVAGPERPAMLNGGFDEVKSRLADTVENGVRSTRRAIKHVRYAAEDLIEEAQHTIKQKPLEAVAIVLTVGILAGALAGGFVTWLGFRRS